MMFLDSEGNVELPQPATIKKELTVKNESTFTGKVIFTDGLDVKETINQKKNFQLFPPGTILPYAGDNPLIESTKN